MIFRLPDFMRAHVVGSLTVTRVRAVDAERGTRASAAMLTDAAAQRAVEGRPTKPCLAFPSCMHDEDGEHDHCTCGYFE